MTPRFRALVAAELAESAALTLRNSRDVPLEGAVGELLQSVAIAMEAAGFHPDETQRGQLYRSIVDYIGEDFHPRRLGGASDQEAKPK